MRWIATKPAPETRRFGWLRACSPLTLAVVSALLLAACSGPADQALATGSTSEAYRASLDPIFTQMSAEQQEAFDWAVSDLDLAELHAKYPNASPSEIIRGEVDEVLETYPDKIQELKRRLVEEKPVREDLRKIVATRSRFFIDSNFFGLQPKIEASIVNGSSRPVSQLAWTASLFVGDATEPVATTVLNNDYRPNGGLKPGDTFTVTFKVGFVKGDERWTTLEIRNAASTRVELVPVLDSIRDFGDRPYLANDATREIENLESNIMRAEGYSGI